MASNKSYYFEISCEYYANESLSKIVIFYILQKIKFKVRTCDHVWLKPHKRHYRNAVSVKPFEFRNNAHERSKDL